MRLIYVRDLTLHDFSENFPRYGILSHRWTADETTLQEFLNPQRNTETAGFQKIKRFCERVADDGLEYGWADTCCIDKSSSAELSEAINSMFKWYKGSARCYVYLEDVTFEQALGDGSEDLSLENSKWFTRGWTLQELIAPGNVTFYSSEWKPFGAKRRLLSRLVEITGIDIEVLDTPSAVTEMSVAERMSWMAHRETTRAEDMAYCLMGIFDVNMPMLYGEGMKAFRRLQEEIMKSCDDQSLFAWTHCEGDRKRTGLLAPHPHNFQYSNGFSDKSEFPGLEGASSVSTGKGVTANVFLAPTSKSVNIDGIQRKVCSAVLKCAERNSSERFAMISLALIDDSRTPSYVRLHEPELKRSRLKGSKETILVRYDIPSRQIVSQKSILIKLYAEFKIQKLVLMLIGDPGQPGQSSWLAPTWEGGHVALDRLLGKPEIPVTPGSHIATVEVIPEGKELAPFDFSVGTTREGQIGFAASNGSELSRNRRMFNETYVCDAITLPRAAGKLRVNVSMKVTNMYLIDDGTDCVATITLSKTPRWVVDINSIRRQATKSSSQTP